MTFKKLLRFPAVSFFLVMLACTIFNTSVISAGDNADDLISASDLTRDAKLASMGNRVLMIEFSSESCSYCRLLEDEFLKPMMRNSEYGEKVVIRSISLSDNDTLIDFDGNTVSASEFAAQYGVSVTPTLIFLDETGKELSDKLVGIWSVDYYGSYIDDRIDSARGPGS
jgi:thioredoxin-related protein